MGLQVKGRNTIQDFDISRGPVVLSYCNDYRLDNVTKSLQTSLDHLGGIGKFISPGDKVLIKPNLLKGISPDACVTTHPAVIEAIVRIVLDHGGHPFIGDSPAFGDLSSVAVSTGMADICKQYSIPLTPFNSPVIVAVPDNMVRRIAIDRAALEADKIINVPKLKTHVQVGFTGGVKNLFGSVVGKRKAMWHFRAGDRDHIFGKMLLEVYKILNPSLHIIDGIIALEGNGPAKGNPRQLGLLGLSGDALSLDRVLCDIINIPVSSVEIFCALKRHFNLEVDIREIDIKGSPVSSFTGKKFVLPERMPIRFDLPRIMLSVLKHLKHKLTGAKTRMEHI